MRMVTDMIWPVGLTLLSACLVITLTLRLQTIRKKPKIINGEVNSHVTENPVVEVWKNRIPLLPALLPNFIDLMAPVEKREIAMVPADSSVKRELFLIKITSFNVRCDSDAPPFSWEHRSPHFEDALNRISADIICLQEATEVVAVGLCAGLGKNWRLSGVPRKHGSEGTQILFDTTVFTFLDSWTWVFNDKGPSPCPPMTPCTSTSVLAGRKCPHVRIFTHAVLVHRESGAVIHVYNTHFPLELDEQEVCARELAAHINRNSACANCTLVCGDFNSHYTPLTKGCPLQILVREVDGLLDAHDFRDEPTFHKDFAADDLPSGSYLWSERFSHRLDYVFVKGGAGVQSATIDRPRYRGSDGQLWRPSDHDAVTAVVAVDAVF